MEIFLRKTGYVFNICAPTQFIFKLSIVQYNHFRCLISPDIITICDISKHSYFSIIIYTFRIDFGMS